MATPTLPAVLRILSLRQKFYTSTGSRGVGYKHQVEAFSKNELRY